MAAKGRIAAATYRITAAHAGYPLYSTMRRQIPSPKVVPSFTEWYAPMTYSERGWWGLNPSPVTCPTNFISPCNLAYTSSLQSRTMLLALLCIINGQARILPRYDRTREAILTCAQKLTQVGVIYHFCQWLTSHLNHSNFKRKNSNFLWRAHGPCPGGGGDWWHSHTPHSPRVGASTLNPIDNFGPRH